MDDLKVIVESLNIGRPRVAGQLRHRKSSLATWRLCRVRHELEYRYGVISPSGEAADLGTRAHAWLEASFDAGREDVPIPADVEELRDGLLWARELMRGLTAAGLLGSAEWSFGKGVAPPLRMESLDHGAHWFAGTVDLVWHGMEPDGSAPINVLDYKTGWGRLPPCEESLELALYALAVQRRDDEAVRVHYAMLRTQEHRTALLTPDQLAVWRDRLCELAAEVETADRSAANPNRYCPSCAASVVCPSYRAVQKGRRDAI